MASSTGAHNPAGAEALARAVREAFTWDTLHLVLACSANKDIEGIVAALTPLGPTVYAAANSSARSAPVDRVSEACRAAGLPTMAYGVLYSWWVVGLGVLVLLTGFYGWALEPSVAE